MMTELGTDARVAGVVDLVRLEVFAGVEGDATKDEPPSKS